MPTPVRVPSWGSRTARFILIGEAPAKWEIIYGRPFAGASGSLLDKWWDEVGLRRSQFFIDNVYQYRAPADKIHLAPRGEVEAWASTLRKRLSCLTRPAILIPTGNTALRALLGRPLWSNSSPKITDLRGSIYKYKLNGHTVKMIPTIHPAATFRSPKVSRLCRADWQRIATEIDAPFNLPKRIAHVNPPRRKVDMLLRRAHARRPMVIDIETNPKAGIILCVGVAFGPRHAYVFSWDDPWHRAVVKKLCEAPNPKILQNGAYDCRWLAKRAGIHVRNFRYDTMAMHHALDAALPHDLATMASLDTRQPFWKRDAKDAEEVKKWNGPLEALYRYNGIDCCVTYELFVVYARRLGIRIEEIEYGQAA